MSERREGPAEERADERAAARPGEDGPSSRAPAARGARAAELGAGVLQALAAVAAALWFRDAAERYAVLVGLASAAALVLTWRGPGARTVIPERREVARGAAVLFALAACLVATPALHVARTRETRAPDEAVAAVARVVGPTLADLAVTARAALVSAGRPRLSVRARFAALAPLADSGGVRRGERAVALLDGRGAPVAWAGTWRVRPDSLEAPRAALGPPGVRTGVATSPFYVLLYASAWDGTQRAVAATVLHAEPPAKAFALPLDAGVLRETGVRGLDVRVLASNAPAPGAPAPAAGAPGAGWHSLAVPGAAEWLALRAEPPDPAAVRTGLLEDARRVAAPGLTLMTVLAAAALWQLGAHTRVARATASSAGLLLPLLILALTPLGALSNATRLFDPAVYFSPLGGPFTATLGALGVTGGVALLAVATAWRGAEAAGVAGWHGPLRSFGGAALGVAVLAGGAYLVRALARGISPPPGGTTVALFVFYQGAFCLVASTVLLWGVALTRPLLARAVGAHPGNVPAGRGGRFPSLYALVGPLLAVAVALLGIDLWTASDGWPAWYPALWVIPALAVVVSRAGRAVVPAAIAVAGIGASTLVWGATTARQVAMAERDIGALAEPDAEALALLTRFGRTLAADSAPAGDAAGAALLRQYAGSPLAAAGYPVAVARWDPGAERGTPPLERVGFVLWGVDSVAVGNAVRAAAASRGPVTRAIAAEPGAATLLAVPQRDGRVATVTLFPRAHFITTDPLDVLLGGRPPVGQPPYMLSLLRDGRGAAAPDFPRTGTLVPQPPPVPRAELQWTRSATVAHADARVLLPDGPASAHVEVMLGSLGVLAERAALLVFVDFAVVGFLWWLPSLDAARWPRPARGWAYWTRSFRARLTAALFGFFAVPTLAFAAWNFAQLQAGDRDARALLVRETLRAAVADGAPASAAGPRGGADRWRTLPPVAARLGAPLLAYEGGVLTGASEPALLALAPTGRMLPPRQMLTVGAGDEVTATMDAPEPLGRALIGLRAALAGDGQRVVLATPARPDELAGDERRRDLGFFVLLAATSGAGAALWLSGVAARQLARPVGSLRRAAIALARGPGSPDDVGRGTPAIGIPTVGTPALGVPVLGLSTVGESGRGASRVAAALERDPPAEFRPVFGAFRQMAVELDAGQVALEAARRRTAAVLRDVASGVIAVDAAGCVTVANPRAVALLGRPLRVGQPVAALVPPEVADPIAQFLADAAAQGARPDGTTPGGGFRPAHAAAFNVTLRGRELRARLTTLGGITAAAAAAGATAEAAGAVLTLDDITDLAHAQRALAWGEMARQVAHEIKNPLTPMRLGVQLLRRAYRDGRGDFGALLESNAERVLAEIDRLDEIARSFSRYGTTSAKTPPPEQVDVAAVAQDVVALERLGGEEVRWELHGPPTAAAWAQDGELREVVLNLLENARLAGAAAVRVTVAAPASADVDEPRVTLSVADDGHGIPPDVLPRIFDPHFSTRTSGSGLGLAIARRLVDGWGGRIAAESVVGKGTTITVTLRAADVPA